MNENFLKKYVLIEEFSENEIKLISQNILHIK